MTHVSYYPLFVLGVLALVLSAYFVTPRVNECVWHVCNAMMLNMAMKPPLMLKASKDTAMVFPWQTGHMVMIAIPKNLSRRSIPVFVDTRGLLGYPVT